MRKGDLMTESLFAEKNAAAFFDLDGTVVTQPSLEWRFVAHLARKGKLRASSAGRWLGKFLFEGVKQLSGEVQIPFRLEAIDRNKLYLAGVPDCAARDWSEQSSETIEFFPDALRQIAWHRERGHAIFFISGTLAPLAWAAASQLAVTGQGIFVAATELESVAGHWTGRISGEAICGPAKARAIGRLAARHDLDLSRCYAYANSSMDRWMLAAVGHPVAVNPGIALAQLAHEYGWPIARWYVDRAISFRRGIRPANTGFIAAPNSDMSNESLIPRRRIHGNNSI